MRADRLLVAVDLDQRGVRRPARRGGSSTRSATRRRRRSRRPRRAAAAPTGVANPPEMPTANGSPSNSPLATAEVARIAPVSSPRRRSAGPAPDSTAPRPAMIAGRSARASASATACDGAPGRTGGELGRGRRVGELDLGRLHVERQHQHHRAALDDRAPHGPRRVGDRGGRAVHALGDRADGLHERVLVDLEVRAQLRRRRVGGQQDQRRARLRRLGQPGDRVRQPRALVHAGHAEPPATPARSRPPCRPRRSRGGRRRTSRRRPRSRWSRPGSRSPSARRRRRRRGGAGSGRRPRRRARPNAIRPRCIPGSDPGMQLASTVYRGLPRYTSDARRKT